MKIDRQDKKLYNIGISYKKADAFTRGKYSLSKENQVNLLREAKENGFDLRPSRGVFGGAPEITITLIKSLDSAISHASFKDL